MLQIFLVSESFVLVDQVIDQVMCSYQPPARLMLFSILQLLSLSEWKSVIPLKIRALRRGCPVYFRLQATFFYKRCRASVTKHRYHSTHSQQHNTYVVLARILHTFISLCLPGVSEVQKAFMYISLNFFRSFLNKQLYNPISSKSHAKRKDCNLINHYKLAPLSMHLIAMTIVLQFLRPRACCILEKG